ncbi:MAG: hypothetical protein U0694_28730 [Anaerolineae bacterium]
MGGGDWRQADADDRRIAYPALIAQDMYCARDRAGHWSACWSSGRATTRRTDNVVAAPSQQGRGIGDKLLVRLPSKRRGTWGCAS